LREILFIYESNKCEFVGPKYYKTREIIEAIKSKNISWINIDQVLAELVIQIADINSNEELKQSGFSNKRREVIQHYAAYKYLISQDSLTEEIIKNTHKILAWGFDEYQPGEYRTVDLYIDTFGSSSCHLFPTYQAVPQLMNKLIIHLNGNFNMSLFSFEKAASISFNFVNIHPFRDGNGRMSRLLLNYILIKEGGLYFPVSLGLSRHPERNLYYRSLKYANSHRSLSHYQYFILRHIQKILSKTKIV
jgi:Fic family protein